MPELAEREARAHEPRADVLIAIRPIERRLLVTEEEVGQGRLGTRRMARVLDVRQRVIGRLRLVDFDRVAVVESEGGDLALGDTLGADPAKKRKVSQREGIRQQDGMR